MTISRQDLYTFPYDDQSTGPVYLPPMTISRQDLYTFPYDDPSWQDLYTYQGFCLKPDKMYR